MLRRSNRVASRDELVKMREEAVEHVERLRMVGDWGAGAADIRKIAERVLVLIEDRLETKR